MQPQQERLILASESFVEPFNLYMNAFRNYNINFLNENINGVNVTKKEVQTTIFSIILNRITFLLL